MLANSIVVSCSQCTCIEGTGWMEKILHNIEHGKGKMSDIDLLWDIQRKIEGNTICPLGDAAACTAQLSVISGMSLNGM